jgi:hypothetical protein
VPTSLSRARISATDPVYFISRAESYFLQAEAVARGWTNGTGNDATLYNAGVDASFAQAGVTRPAGLYPYPTSGSFATKLDTIITQKWVALAGTKQGLEAYFERNRTGIPANSAVASPTPTASNGAYTAGGALAPGYIPGQFTYPAQGVTSGGKYPRRLLFPNVERTRNPNTPPQVNILVPVWWDTRP